MNDRDVRTLLALVTNWWPTVPFKTDDMESVAKAWRIVLADITLDEATLVLAEVSRRGVPFPPTPGDVAKRVLDARDRRAGIAAPDVDEAWAEVQQGIRRCGLVAGPPEWTHTAIAAVVRAIGWRELCMSDNPDVVRAHFLRMYAPAVERVVSDQRALLALPSSPGDGRALPRHTPDVQ